MRATASLTLLLLFITAFLLHLRFPSLWPSKDCPATQRSLCELTYLDLIHIAHSLGLRLFYLIYLVGREILEFFHLKAHSRNAATKPLKCVCSPKCRRSATKNLGLLEIKPRSQHLLPKAISLILCAPS